MIGKSSKNYYTPEHVYPRQQEVLGHSRSSRQTLLQITTPFPAQKVAGGSVTLLHGASGVLVIAWAVCIKKNKRAKAVNALNVTVFHVLTIIIPFLQI